MAAVTTAGIHHLALTVSDPQRSRDFYENMLGFQFVTQLGPKTILSNNSTLLALNAPMDATQALPNDRFTEFRVGLDHLSFSVGARADLEAAVALFDANGVPHGGINDLGEYGLPIYVLAFRDPDNIQLELTAPHA